MGKANTVKNVSKDTKNDNNNNTAKDGVTSSTAGKKKRSRRSGVGSFETYVYRVLKQVHPEHGLSKKAMSVMNSVCEDVFQRVCTEAASVSRYNNHRTLTSKDIQTAVRLIFPGELSNHAVSAGVQSVARFNASSAETTA